MAAKKLPEMTLHDLLINKLRALYDIENEIIKALPKMGKAASDEELENGFAKHLKQTQVHAQRLEKAFSILEEKPKKLRSEAIRGLIEDAVWVIKNVKGADALDANLIAAAQYIEHYEIAGYTSAKEWAAELGYSEVEDLLQQTLDEEIETDETLNDLALSTINERANTIEEEE